MLLSLILLVLETLICNVLKPKLLTFFTTETLMLFQSPFTNPATPKIKLNSD